MDPTRSPAAQVIFAQWKRARGRNLVEARHPFFRNWETLLEDAILVSAQERRDAELDIRALAKNGWVEIQSVPHRPHLIARILIPLAVEWRWGEAFGFIAPSGEETRKIAQHPWTPELDFLSTARLTLPFDELQRLDAFFKNNGSSRLVVPVKERSLEIFRDEKRLESLVAGSALFLEGRLTLAQLRCFSVAEPLGWQRGPVMNAPVLILENASTWDSYARWNRDSAQFSAVIYGRGKAIIDTISRMPEIFTEIGGKQPILYFGDLDPAGLRIPQAASRRGERDWHLPPIQPHLESYRWLFSQAADRAVPFESDRPALEADPAWSILRTGHRVAQEHIGWEFLQSHRSQAKKIS